MRVLVAGATGYLGSHVGRELKRRGHEVRSLIRRPEQRAAVQNFSDEIVVASVTSPSTLRGIADRTDAVFSSIGITRQRGSFTYEDVDFQGNLNLLTAAMESRVPRFVYVSIFRGRELRHVRLIAAKERFVDALQAADIESRVVRPTGFFSDMAAILQMARRGLVVLLRDGTARINPVSGHDVAAACVDALLERRRSDVNVDINVDVALDVGGPDIYSYNDIALLAATIVRKRSRIWHVPAALVRFIGSTLDRVAPPYVSGSWQFVEAMSSLDMNAPAIGHDRLGPFFESLAAS